MNPIMALQNLMSRLKLFSLSDFEETITGKPGYEISEKNTQLLTSVIIGISVVAGIADAVNSSQIPSHIQVSHSSLFLYTLIIAIMTTITWWITLSIIFKATFLKSASNAILGLVSSWILLFALGGMSYFVLVGADWDIIWANRVMTMIGPFFTTGVTQPHIDNQTWRMWPGVFLVSAIISAAYGTSGERPHKFLIPFTAIMAICMYYVLNPHLINYNPDSTFLKLVAVGLVGYTSFGLSYIFSINSEEYLINRLRNYLGLASVLTFFIVIMVLDPPEFFVENGISEMGVDPLEWGGLYVNLLIVGAACVGGFVISVILAFGRQSELPFFKYPSIFIIEFIRSGPMIAWLFITFFLVPDVIRPVYTADAVVRTIFIISLFGGCYLAEVLRGGLQAVPSGQKEAAIALGLTPTQAKLTVELPAAIRTTLPAMVSIFIGLWKDTTLVYLLGVLDFFAMSKILASTNIEYGDDYLEPLLFTALIFWIFAFYLSRISLRIEKSLGLVREGGGEMT